MPDRASVRVMLPDGWLHLLAFPHAGQCEAVGMGHFPTSSSTTRPLHLGSSALVCSTSHLFATLFPDHLSPASILWKQELISAKESGSGIDDRELVESPSLESWESSWPDTLYAGCACRQEPGPDHSGRMSQFGVCFPESASTAVPCL